MSGDPDLPMANHALQVLRQARMSRNEVAALKIWDLVHEVAGTGLRSRRSSSGGARCDFHLG
jgi:hypothetical protein